jgi:uncharacterized protein (DUF58 family)
VATRDRARAGIARRQASSEKGSPGVYVTLEDLIRMRSRARGFSFLPRQPIESLLSGRHASRMRGRGLNFEEIRKYLPGDDIRTIDWKITARTGETHVRVYTEERDRPAILVVDQRINMFFGSTRALKSVVAAEMAALGAWRVFDAGDRVGAIVFNDEESVEVRPQRSRRTVLAILHQLLSQNQALRADHSAQTNPLALNQALKSVARLAGHDYIVAVLSDFDGADEETTRLITRLAIHNDVVVFPIHDPTSRMLPADVDLVVSDGRLQAEFRGSQGKVRDQVRAVSDQRMGRIMEWQDSLGVPVLPISTAEEPVDQLIRLTGGGRR